MTAEFGLTRYTRLISVWPRTSATNYRTWMNRQKRHGLSSGEQSISLSAIFYFIFSWAHKWFIGSLVHWFIHPAKDLIQSNLNLILTPSSSKNTPSTSIKGGNCFMMGTVIDGASIQDEGIRISLISVRKKVATIFGFLHSSE